jgi:hypothetical protein
MGNAYIAGKYKLTAMQNACYNYLKDNKGQKKTIDEIIRGVYSCFKDDTCPDIWTYEEKVTNVTKWCNTLTHLKLIQSDGNGNFIF